MDPIKRNILATGVAATALAAASHVFAQQAEQGGTVMSFYGRGPVVSAVRRSVSGFPLPAGD
jgi:hypothetical protein